MTGRLIQGAGTTEQEWLPWLPSQNFQTLALQALCPPGRRLVVVAPHPDDEIIGCGGLLAAALEAQRVTQVISVTDGEASHAGSYHGSDPGAQGALGARRVQESLAGLQLLGWSGESVVRLGMADGALPGHIAELSRALQALLQPHDVVVTTWARDGHPDHEATGLAAAQACAARGCCLLQMPVWMWHWSAPNDSQVPWANLVAFEVPARALQLKNLALQQHQSQLEERGASLGPVLGPSIRERALRKHEYFFFKAPPYAPH